MLLPVIHNKLLAHCERPYQDLEGMSVGNYLINMDGKHKFLHIDILKEYYTFFFLFFFYISEPRPRANTKSKKKDPLAVGLIRNQLTNFNIN